MPKIKDIYNGAKETIGDVAEHINVENMLVQISKVPGIKVDRTKFLEKELKVLYPPEIVQKAIDHSPAYAGIPKSAIDIIAKRAIRLETNKVSVLSFAAGVPGGTAMLGTIPADLTQYFAFSLRIMQKLAYLFGFQEFEINESEIDDNTINEMLLFLGIMFGAQEANAGVKILAQAAAAQAVKKLERAAIMQIPAYVGLKNLAKYLGLQMNRQILQKAIGGAIPVAGGLIMGGISFTTFRISASRLRKRFLELPIADPDFYKDQQQVDAFIKEPIDAEFTSIEI